MLVLVSLVVTLLRRRSRIRMSRRAVSYKSRDDLRQLSDYAWLNRIVHFANFRLSIGLPTVA